MNPEDNEVGINKRSENDLYEFFKSLYIEDKNRKISLRERYSQKNGQKPQDNSTRVQKNK